MGGAPNTWWEKERHNYDLYIAETVLDEVASGDTDAAQRRLSFLQDLPLLDLTEAVSYIRITCAQPATDHVNRLLFGKFTEHLGRNIYNGMWAQVLQNTSFAESGREFRIDSADHHLPRRTPP